jgi:hypothetical protein
MGLSGSRLCVDSNSLTPLGPSSKQNQTVLFYSNDFTQFCKSLGCLFRTPLTRISHAASYPWASLFEQVHANLRAAAPA